MCILGAARVESLLMQWVCLEVNILCVIPILLGGLMNSSFITRVKYFVSQRSASVVFLISIIIIDNISMAATIASAAIIFKLGIPPFHRWIMRIIMRVGLVELVLILTLQKFIPLIILSQIELRVEIIFVIFFSSLGIIVLRMNSTFSINYILFLSSVGNGLWIVVSLFRGVWLIFLILYSLMLVMVCLLITLSKMNKLRDLPLMNTTMKLAVTFNFLNLGGIPPLIGFSVKLMVLKNIAILGVNVSIILVLLSVMILYIYICTSYQSFTFSPESLPMVSNPTSGGIGILVVILILRFRIFTWLTL